MNPVDYAIASITGAGLRDEEITISFAKMIYRKTKAQETGTTFRLSAENLSAVMKAKFTKIFFSTNRVNHANIQQSSAILTIRMSFLKGCLLFSFNLHLEKCVRQVKFFIETNFYWGKFLTGKSDEISRKIRRFSPISYLMFDFPPRFPGKLKPQSLKYRP